ncbi:thiol-disulfide oxidoreductase DCC family protein [Bacteroidota bacterium]
MDDAIVLFDGVCNLCNRWVTFVIDRDPHSRFRFAALQSDVARRLLELHSDMGATDSIVLLENGGIYLKSDAVLRIVARMNKLWPVLAIMRVVPRFVRDPAYEWIARHRYRWFGYSDTCRVPTKELESRFL